MDESLNDWKAKPRPALGDLILIPAITQTRKYRRNIIHIFASAAVRKCKMRVGRAI
jgi:hypothetical protein